MIFVCGPIIKSHPQTNSLFQKFRNCRKIGAGVSIFPPDHQNYLDPFDHVLAREGKSKQFEDVAIVAPKKTATEIRTAAYKQITIGIVLRGYQNVHGSERCLWQKTAEIVEKVSENIIAERGGKVVMIENHLQRSGVLPCEIEAQYSDCDLILTSRFHGAMLAIRQGIPFIAIDQIKGGAKVTNLLRETAWPYIFQADKTDTMQITQAAFELLNGSYNQILLEIREKAIMRANLTLVCLNDLIKTHI